MITSIQKIAVLISGNGSNLQALIDSQSNSHYQIALVISNRPDAFGLKRAEKAQIPTLCLDHKTFASREAFDLAMMQHIDDARIDFVILAGFMRILTPQFTEYFLGQMLNIHPSLLPKYTGLNTHQRVLDANETEHGVSIHFVTSELDGGPVILQAKIPIEPKDTAESLQQKIHTKEHLIYPIATEWLATGQIALFGNKVLFQGNCLDKPLLFKER